jgi:hypothetical protein
MRLEHVLKTVVLTVSATHCGEMAVPDEDASIDSSFDEASRDANDANANDVNDASSPFVTDVAQPTCDAGAPTVVDACGGCCAVTQEHCPIAASDLMDDAGYLWNCGRYCPNNGYSACRIVGTDVVECYCMGRRFDGYEERRATSSFAEMARLEAASVFAFERLHDELGALGASPRLLKRVRRAIADERRHTRMMTRLATRFGQRVAPVRAPRFTTRSIESIAIENATEGCVRELFGALVATWHGVHARDPAIRRTFRAIARDETRHAELALRVAVFLSSHLDAPARERTRNARVDAVGLLGHEARSSRDRALHAAIFGKSAAQRSGVAARAHA